MQYLHTSNLPAKCVVEITITSIISSTQLKGERGYKKLLLQCQTGKWEYDVITKSQAYCQLCSSPHIYIYIYITQRVIYMLTQREKPWEPCGNLVSANRLKSRQNTPKKREREKQEVTQNGIDSIVLNRSKCIQMCNKSLNLSQNVISSTESLASLIIDKWAFCNWVRWMWWAKGGNKGEGRRESS